jgi:GNAT superfamily N-acetyltransferase
MDIGIGAGSRDDYLALARWHYRGREPATIDRVLVARVGGTREAGGRVVGVLVVSHPTLNGRWRDRAWPGVFPRDKSARAHALNRELRTISRVIVDPSWRGVGIAGMLVRAYLAKPATRRTEAIAAMGAFCPLFSRAGMREVRVPRSEPDRALARALRRERFPAWRLCDGGAVRGVLRRRPRLREALDSWVKSHKGPRERGLRGAALGAIAAERLLLPPRVFVMP